MLNLAAINSTARFSFTPRNARKAVNLTNIHCARLHELLEHDSIVAMLTCRDANG